MLSLRELSSEWLTRETSVCAVSVQALRSQVVTGPPHWPAVKAACVQVVTVASQGFYSLWFIDFPAASRLTSLGQC